jgi:hypothetical protein
MKRLPLVLFLVASLLTVVSTFLLPRIHFSGRLSALFPRDPASLALGRYVNAFGGGDLTMVLVTGKDASKVAVVARAVAKACEGKPAIASAVTAISVDQRSLPPATLAFAFADTTATSALHDSMTDEGIAKRLDSTRALLLSPLGGDLSDVIVRDPLRWWELLRPKKERLAAGIARDETGELSADQGRARFVLITTRGSALQSRRAIGRIGDRRSHDKCGRRARRSRGRRRDRARCRALGAARFGRIEHRFDGACFSYFCGDFSPPARSIVSTATVDRGHLVDVCVRDFFS